MIEFIIYGEPKGKVNMRPVKMGSHLSLVNTPENRNYMSLVRDAWFTKAKDFRFPDDEPLILHIKAFFSIPKSVSKKKREQMLSYEIKPTKKPDCDNISKVVCDALNGIAFKDDSNISALIVAKYYGETPRVEVRISTIKEQFDPYLL